MCLQKRVEGLGILNTSIMNKCVILRILSSAPDVLNVRDDFKTLVKFSIGNDVSVRFWPG